MTDFEDILNNFVLNWEGRTYTDDQNDPGKGTMWGISQAGFDGYCQKKGLTTHDVKDLTQEEIISVYFDIWTSAKCDQMPKPINQVHFDCSVNTGITEASEILQRVLNVNVDGIIGEITLNAINNFNTAVLCDRLIMGRESFYTELATQKPNLKDYLQGWLDRCEALKKFIGG